MQNNIAVINLWLYNWFRYTLHGYGIWCIYKKRQAGTLARINLLEFTLQARSYTYFLHHERPATQFMFELDYIFICSSITVKDESV